VGRIRRALTWTGLALLGLSAVCVVRAVTLTAPTDDPGDPPALPAFDADAAVRALSAAVAVPTVSRATGGAAGAFDALHVALRERFPRVHARLERTALGEDAVVFRWPGRDPAAPAVILSAHLDVVPVEPGTEAQWTHPPFSGAVADGFVWGRGALDDKLAAVATLAAVESLLAAGHAPARDVWLAFGHDEEVGGGQGARNIAAWLGERGVRAEFLLDEGSAVVEGVLPGLTAPLALIGVAEKGLASFELTLQAEGGHSSMPPPHGAIGRLAAAVVRLEDRPMPAELRGAASAMLDRLAPEMALTPRAALANRWLFEPLLLRGLALHPASNAMIRTTAAPTIFTAGTADNVLAAQARAVVNFRVLPGDTLADVEAHIREVVADDEIAVRCLDRCWEPSSTSPLAGPGWDHVYAAIRWHWPHAVVSPSLVVAATDARHYAALTDRIYRFAPMHLADADRARLHGTDERVPVDDVATAVRFYQTVLLTATR
jgi:carboxypeptidase PM20D1